jgi:hypothetical protein
VSRLVAGRTQVRTSEGPLAVQRLPYQVPFRSTTKRVNVTWECRRTLAPARHESQGPPPIARGGRFLWPKCKVAAGIGCIVSFGRREWQPKMEDLGKRIVDGKVGMDRLSSMYFAECSQYPMRPLSPLGTGDRSKRLVHLVPGIHHGWSFRVPSERVTRSCLSINLLLDVDERPGLKQACLSLPVKLLPDLADGEYSGIDESCERCRTVLMPSHPRTAF